MCFGRYGRLLRVGHRTVCVSLLTKEILFLSVKKALSLLYVYRLGKSFVNMATIPEAFVFLLRLIRGIQSNENLITTI